MPNKKKSLTQMPGSSKRQRADTNLTRAQEKRLAREAEEIRKKAQREEDRMNMPSMMAYGGKVKKVVRSKRWLTVAKLRKWVWAVVCAVVWELLLKVVIITRGKF